MRTARSSRRPSRSRAAWRAGVGLAVLGATVVFLGSPIPSALGQNLRLVSYRPMPQGENADLFEGAVAWLNTAKPIDSRDLKGKIILLDFWTYCCINCHHVIPDLEKLEKKYPNELVVIGIHSPKFDAERETENIRQKVREYRIKHPVINDANMVLWRRFGVNSWPTLAVIDATGKFRGAVSGEGHYEQLDEFIGKLAADHKAKKELNETPFVVYAESDKPSDGPLLYPGKVLADPAGNRLFITDTGHNRIVVTDLAGKALDVIGTGEQGLRDGPFASSQFNRPQGICLVEGNLFVADTENHAIRRVDLGSKTVETVAGDGKQSYRREGGGKAAEIGLNSPWDLVQIPGTSQLIVAMAGPHQLWKYDFGAGTIAVWAGSGREDIIDGTYARSAFAQPSGLATDGTFVYVADSEVSGIRAVSISGKERPQVQTVVGMGLFEFGDVDGRGDSVRLQHCLGLAYKDGTLYIADTYNNKIKVCDPGKREVRALVGSRQPGSSDTAPSFYQPGGLSVAGDDLYVADTNNHQVRVVDLKTKAVRTIELQGVAPPQPPRRKPTFRNPTEIRVASAKLAPAKQFLVNVKLAIPGFKVVPDTPSLYLLEAANAPDAFAPTVDPSGNRVIPTAEGLSIPVELSKVPAEGSTLELKLSASIFACSETSGFCTMKNFAWTIPVTFEAGAPNSIALSTGAP